MRIYIPLLLKTKIGIEFYGQEIEMDLDWAEGMVGAMPAFESREAAQAYAGEDAKIVVAEVDDE